MRIIREREDIIGALDRGDASKLISPNPEAVEAIFFPKTAYELGCILRDQCGPIRIAGGRTGLTGGCVPQLGRDRVKEVMIRLDELLTVPEIGGYEIRTEKDVGKGMRTITYARNKDIFVLPAGATLDERTDILARHERMFPIHPTSQDATVGGTVTTNATGLEGAFGSTRDWTKVLGLYLADGCFIHLPGPYTIDLSLPTYKWNENVKNTSGIFAGKGRYPLDLFIGHDGALAVCAYAGFKTLPKRVKGDDIWAGMIFFDNCEKALDFVIEAASPEYALQNGKKRNDIYGDNLGIVGVDWVGGAGMKVGEGNVPENAVVGLEVGFLMDDDVTLERAVELMEKHGALETQWFSPDKVGEIRRFRHSIPDRTNDLVYKKVGTDCAVPIDKMKEMHGYWLDQLDQYTDYCRSVEFEGVEGEFGVEIGHPFSGHMHYNLLNSEETFVEARKVQGRLIQKAIFLGGVPSAEHGIGAKTAYVKVDGEYRDVPLLALLYGKKALDEVYYLKVQLGAERLNRGVLVNNHF